MYNLTQINRIMDMAETAATPKLGRLGKDECLCLGCGLGKIGCVGQRGYQAPHIECMNDCIDEFGNALHAVTQQEIDNDLGLTRSADEIEALRAAFPQYIPVEA